MVIRARSPFRYYGPSHTGMADRLEKEWCERFGCRYALAVNSGTAALHISLLAIGVGPGDEVLVPGFMWVSCLSAIVRTGAIPRLVDIDESYNMDPDDLRAKIGQRSKAILLVHMMGAPRLPIGQRLSRYPASV
jgi:dTDP-4-amino-4,6-dideoxygalactose transaminase